MDIKENIYFLLSHFDDESLFPRKMMTRKINYQFTVYSKEEIVLKCTESDLVDCRINAYPQFTKWEKYDMIRYPPNFIFIDLDLSTFSKFKTPMKVLDKALGNTLNKISLAFSQERSPRSPRSPINNRKQLLVEFTTEVKPTVLWSGNGYHIYLPIEGLILDNYEPFSIKKYPNLFSAYHGKYSDYSVSEVFLLFAKDYFTDGAADPQHRPKFKTCLIRVPNTYNSKCLANGLSLEESKVKLIQKWNGIFPPIQCLTREFWKWLIQEEIDSRIRLISAAKKQPNYKQTGNYTIKWIEDLLQKGIPDGRKETLRLIVGPYLIKRKSYEESVFILEKWLDKCNKVKPLDREFNPKQRISSSLKNTKGFLRLDNLKLRNPSLYNMIQSKRILL